MGWVLAKKQKPSRRGSISGAPLGTAAEGDGGMGWGSVYQVVVVVELCVRETQGRGRGLGQKTETEPSWLGFVRAV